MAAYEGNRKEVVSNSLHSDPVAIAITMMMDATSAWQGTATQLQSALEAQVPEKIIKLRSWPKENYILSKRLKRLASFLLESGIDIEFFREGRLGTRIITIKKVPQVSSALSKCLQIPSLPFPDGPGEQIVPEVADDKKPSEGAINIHWDTQTQASE